MLLGAHMSIAGGIDQAIDRGAQIGCSAIQIFTKNNNQWFSPKIPDEQIKSFFEKRKATGLECVYAHDSYLINLGSPKPDLHQKSVNAFAEEMESKSVELVCVVKERQ